MTETQAALTVLVSAFRDFTIERANTYDRFLQDIPAPLLRAAIQSLILTAKFPPSIAEIREEAEKIMNRAKSITPPDASRAWARLQRGLSRWGTDRKAEFMAEIEQEYDPVLIEAADRFDWGGFGMSGLDDAGNWEARFKKTYNHLAAMGVEEKRVAPLAESAPIQALISGLGEAKALEAPHG